MKLLFVLLICTASLAGQQEAAEAVYRLEVAIHEVESDKRTATRDYTLLVRDGTKATSRTGARLPVPSGDGFQFVDVGANLDFTLREAGDNVKLNADLELSGAGEIVNGAPAPTIKQLRYKVSTLIPVGKATLIGKLDEPTGDKRYEVEVTAVKVDL